MPATSLPTKNKPRRRISLYKIVIAVICFATVLPVPTHSFTSSPTPAASLWGRSHYSQKVFPSIIIDFAVSQKQASPATAILLSKKNEQGGEKRQFDDEGLFAEKNIPGLAFTTILTLWHFWIGPALKPIILDMQQ